MKLKEYNYNNIIWDVPILFTNAEFLHILDKCISTYGNFENPFKIIHGHFYDPINICFINMSYLLNDKDISSKKTFQLNFELNKNHAIFYDEKFANIMSKLNEINSEVVFNDNFMYNYVKNKFFNIKLVASYMQLFKESISSNKIDFYENLIQKCDRVILEPYYVKNDLYKDYKNYSDMSKFEIIVDFDVNTFLLIEDIIKLKDIGIKYFRINNCNYTPIQFLQQLFYYIFVPDSLSYFTISEYLDEHYFVEQFY